MSDYCKNTSKEIQRRLLVGTPTRGSVRMEWVLGRYGQIIPCNWSMHQTYQFLPVFAPVGYLVADAQNIILKQAIEGDFEWLLLIEDDTIPPPDAFLRVNEYIRSEEVPVVSGLYYTKSMPPEPLVYRGRGNSYYDKFKLGDRVWADGIPTGFFLCSMKIMRILWDESPEYLAGDVLTRRVFEQPEKMWFDPELNSYMVASGTSDLYWCDRVMREDVIRRAGWKKIGKKKYPFLIDTNLFCKHISPDGTVYPPQGIIPNAK